MNFYWYQHPHRSVQVFYLPRVSSCTYMCLLQGAHCSWTWCFLCHHSCLPCIRGTSKILHQFLKSRENWVCELYWFVSDFQKSTDSFLNFQPMFTEWTNEWPAYSLLFTFSTCKMGCEGQLPTHPSSHPYIHPSSHLPIWAGVMQSVRWKSNENSQAWREVPEQQIPEDLCLPLPLPKGLGQSQWKEHISLWCLRKKEIKNRETRETQICKL